MQEIPQNSFCPSSREDWRNWLEQNYQTSNGVWLIRYKKVADRKTVELDAAIEEAICYGWIDSLPRKLDERRTMLYFSPRKPKSNWSRINKERVARMEAQGKMTPVGLAKVAAAKIDGSWDALRSVDALEIPNDLAAKFKNYPGAAENWNKFPLSVRRGILEWILKAKRDATRSKRIEETATLAQKNERANQWKAKK